MEHRMEWSKKANQEEWLAVACPYCHAAADSLCVGVAAFGNGSQDKTEAGATRPRPHPSRETMGARVAADARRVAWLASPAAAAARTRSGS